jgi:nanoRNase/pAp phosphatase (c-di-AMP/oligoRNAs hydrolase)
MTERLHRLYERVLSDDRVLVIISADPDAISSALALKRLLWRRVAAVTIAHTNVMQRPDNLAMTGLLKIPLVPWKQVNLKEYNRRAMVDSQPVHFGGLVPGPMDIIIDHHPLTDVEAPFMDIRPEYGATASIMTEYLRAAKIAPNRNLSTALFYGIKTDTNNFARQGQLEDVRAFRFLFPHVNLNLISKIEKSEITQPALKYFRQALVQVKLARCMASVFLPALENADTLVQLADFFMRVHDVDQSIVGGVVKDALIVIYRTVGERRNAGKSLARAFGDLGSAGGHKAMARAEIPLRNLDPKLLGKEGGLERFFNRRIQTLRPRAGSGRAGAAAR